MADIAGTENRKGRQNKCKTPPPHPRLRRSMQKKTLEEGENVVPSYPEKCLRGPEIKVQPVNGF